MANILYHYANKMHFKEGIIMIQELRLLVGNQEVFLLCVCN